MKHLTVPVVSGTPQDIDSFWKLPFKAADATPITFGTGYSWIAIDPQRTTPNVVLGVLTPGTALPVALVPGRVLPLPKGTNFVSVYNISRAIVGSLLFNLIAAGKGLIGRVSLVVGTPEELPSWIASLKWMAPSPKVNVLALLNLPTNVIPNGFTPFPTSNLRGLRVSVYTMNAGVIIDPPADFSATLRPAVYTIGFPGASSPAGSVIGPGLDGDALDVSASAPILPGYHQQGDLDLVFTPTNLAHDFEIPCPAAAMQFLFIAVAGTGIDNVVCAVEGR